jgi:hypothetical protein
LDPYSLPANVGRCTARVFARNYDETIELSRRAETLDPELRLTPCTLMANVLKGSVGDAVKAASIRFPEKADAFARALATGGTEGFLRAYLECLPEGQEYERAGWHALLGERDAAFAELERAFVMRRATIGFLWVDPRFDGLRDDPRFLDLARRLGLPQAKAAAGKHAAAN